MSYSWWDCRRNLNLITLAGGLNSEQTRAAPRLVTCTKEVTGPLNCKTASPTRLIFTDTFSQAVQRKGTNNDMRTYNFIRLGPHFFFCGALRWNENNFQGGNQVRFFLFSQFMGLVWNLRKQFLREISVMITSPYLSFTVDWQIPQDEASILLYDIQT